MHAMSQTSPLPASVIPLEDAKDSAIAGAKAATLAALLASGHRVPPGFVVPVGTEPDLASIRAGLAELPPGPVAVRSSAVAEDGSHTSFAGQLLSELDVEGAEQVLAAVHRCRASWESAGVQTYRQNAAPSDDGMAVLVQRMVPARSAGVAFGVNPVTGDSEVLIQAVAGLGDKLVSGEVEGETWTATDETLQPPVSAQALNEDDARRIVELVQALGDARGGPQDVEWALAGGELYLLQSRPITAVPVRPDFSDDPTEGVWFKDEAHVSSTVSAFASDTYFPALSGGMGSMTRQFGLMVDGMQFHWRSGEWYGRAVPPGGKDGPAPPWWVLAVLTRLVPAIRARTRAAQAMLAPGALDAIVHRWRSGGREAFEAEVRALGATDCDALDDDALLSHLDAVQDLMERGQVTHFELFMPWVVGVYRYVHDAEELLGWDTTRVLGLLRGASEASTAPGRELAELAARLRDCTDDVDAVAEHDDLLAALRTVDPALADEATAWLERWGLRASAYDPGSPTLAEQPGLLLGRLREGLVEATVTVHDAGDLDEARASLLDRPDDLAHFEAAYADAVAIFPLREDNVLITDNLVLGVARRAAMAIGRRLRERGGLERVEDAVELKAAELRSALSGELKDSSPLARRRRLERAWVAAHPGPSLLCGEIAPPPDLRGVPAALRAFNGPFLWMMGIEFPEMSGAPQPDRSGDGIQGTAAWPGRYTGTARIVRDERDLVRVRPGDVLVASVTTPAWSIVFPRIGALVTDVGGPLSHAAIVAREHGIPTVLATGVATARIRDGQRVVVDGTHGTVEVA